VALFAMKSSGTCRLEKRSCIEKIIYRQLKKAAEFLVRLRTSVERRLKKLSMLNLLLVLMVTTLKFADSR
jgi:hypothetical protein